MGDFNIYWGFSIVSGPGRGTGKKALYLTKSHVGKLTGGSQSRFFVYIWNLWPGKRRRRRNKKAMMGCPRRGSVFPDMHFLLAVGCK